jgi:hypothetical protein
MTDSLLYEIFECPEIGCVSTLKVGFILFLGFSIEFGELLTNLNSLEIGLCDVCLDSGFAFEESDTILGSFFWLVLLVSDFVG